MSHSSLSRAGKGDRFPTWDATRAYVIGCGGNRDDLAQWKQWWKDADLEVRLDKVGTAPTAPNIKPIPRDGAPFPGSAATSALPAVNPSTNNAPSSTRATQVPAVGREVISLNRRRASASEDQALAEPAVRLVPAGPGTQQRRVIGASSRPPGAHRRSAADERIEEHEPQEDIPQRAPANWAGIMLTVITRAFIMFLITSLVLFLIS